MHTIYGLGRSAPFGLVPWSQLFVLKPNVSPWHFPARDAYPYAFQRSLHSTASLIQVSLNANFGIRVWLPRLWQLSHRANTFWIWGCTPRRIWKRFSNPCAIFRILAYSHVFTWIRAIQNIVSGTKQEPVQQHVPWNICFCVKSNDDLV